MINKRILLASVVLGGPIVGLLLGSALPPQMKPASDMPWRTAAREKALEVDSYSVANTAYYAHGPHLPWLNPMGPPSTARFVEDYYRARAVPTFADDYASMAPVSYEPEPVPHLAVAMEDSATEAELTAEQLAPEPVSEVRLDDDDDFTPAEPGVEDAVDFGG